MYWEDLASQGRGNIYTSRALSISEHIYSLRKDAIKNNFKDFRQEDHRLEFVAKVHDIDFINDSRATNVNAAYFALDSMLKPTIWIVGGQDDNIDYTSLRRVVKQKVKAIYCIGRNNDKIIECFSDLVPQIFTADLKTAVERAFYSAHSNDVVLFSPACPSLDEYHDFNDRGEQFKEIVRGL